MFFQLTPVARNILILNVGLAIIQALTSVNGAMYGSPLIEYGSMYHFSSENFYPFQIVTHMFLHADMTHLLMNMLPIVFFGPMLEQTLGEKRFITLYMVSGIGAGLFFSLVQHLELSYHLQSASPQQIQWVYDNLPGMVGASGAVFGILMMAALLFPNTRIMLLLPPIPMKLKYFVMIYGAIELFSGFRNNPKDNVAHFAHIGGMLFAFILLQIWRRQARK